MDHFEVLEKDLTVNGISIIVDGAEAAAAYRKGDYFTFGKKMGAIPRNPPKRNMSQRLFKISQVTNKTLITR
jgi:hypothetical protein